MTDFNNIKLEPHIKLNFGKPDKKGCGGQGGSVLIYTEKIEGTGSILADGGDGVRGGNGGNINIIAKENKFKGKISAQGGRNTK